MARIGDSPEQQKINELNEQQYNRRKLNEKKGDETRRAAAFNEVMNNKVQREQGRRTAKKQNSNQQAETKGRSQKASQETARRLPKNTRDAARKSALTRATRQGLVKGRSKGAKLDKAAETERGTELDRVRGEEREQVDTEVRRDDRDDAVRAEEKQQTVVELSVDPDGRGSDQRRQRNGRDSDGQGGRQDDRAGGVSAAEGPRGAHHVKLPAELVAQIAKAIAVATAAQGGSEVHIALKGDLLDGITVRVAARKGGKIRCIFEGCDPQTRNLIEASKGDLMRGLAKKGLELDILRAR